MEVQVITVTTKGQIAIPVNIRKQMSIEPGDKLTARIYKDTLMLNVLRLPDSEEIKKSMDEAIEWAASVGYKESDVNDIVKSVRKIN